MPPMLSFHTYDFLATRVNGVIPFWKYRMRTQIKLIEVASAHLLTFCVVPP